MRGQGIPVEIKRKIAEYFTAHRYNKKSRTEARKIFAEMAKTDKKLDKYVDQNFKLTF